MSEILAQLAGFFLDPQYLRILYVTFTVFLGMMLLWFSYKQLSKRDLFPVVKKRYHEVPLWSLIIHWLKYLFLFPLWTFFWFVLFVLCLRVLSYKADINEIMFLGIVLVSSVRISAYFSENMAEDLAKMLPLALLAAFLLNPSFISINIEFEDVLLFQGSFLNFAKYLLFIIILEFVLGVGKKVYLHFWPQKEDGGQK